MKKYVFTAKNHMSKGIIYCWVNNNNNKCYVGSSINFTARLYKYYSYKYLNFNNSIINNALLKYGYSCFSFHILEFCKKDISIK